MTGVEFFIAPPSIHLYSIKLTKKTRKIFAQRDLARNASAHRRSGNLTAPASHCIISGMNKKRRMPIGIQEFSQIVEDNCVYVDKTKFIWEMVDSGRFYFLSRPRRFGKSLLVSTLHEYFAGNKELFKGLYIYERETEWKAHPVFHFDFSGQVYNNQDSLSYALDAKMKKYEKQFEITDIAPSLPLRFQTLLETAYEKTGLGCVVLVDEYDKSLLDSFENPDLNMKFRELFKGFFGVIKGSSRFIKFAFFTGITKLRNVSGGGGGIPRRLSNSDLNNLNDISLDEAYSDICGINQEELEKCFAPEIQGMADKEGITKDECLLQLKNMYDGYHFSKKLLDVYNPFSVVNALSKNDISSYWVSQSTPTFLINRLKSGNWDLIDYDEGYKVDADLLGEIEQDPKNPTPLLYQSGYLTIKEYDKTARTFTLSYPNEEIRNGFVKFIVPAYLNTEQNTMSMNIRDITNALNTCDLDTLFDCLKAVYATLPYYEGAGDKDKMLERDFKNVLSIVFVLVGAYIACEPHFSRGRSDCVVQTKDYVYIFEFKRDKSAKEALAQIDEKGYADAFKSDKRKIVKLGVNFSSAERNVNEWVVSE